MIETQLDSCSVSRKVQISTDDRESGFVDHSYVPPNGASVSTGVIAQHNQKSDSFSVGAQLASIVSVCDGTVNVDFPGNRNGPRPARSTAPLRNLIDKVLIVLLANGEPLIVGQVYDSIPIIDVADETADVFIKGRRVRIETESDLVIVAGSTRIHLDVRGKIVTSADQIVSRARSTNRV